MITMSALATMYVPYVVTATAAGTVIDPRSDAVSFAFKSDGSAPSSGDWKTGSWDLNANSGFIAQCLVGPDGGATTLAAGTYTVWIKVLDDPETVIQPVGMLTIT